MRLGGRAEALDCLRADDAFDVLVVGGGITGAGIAREAARRGLRTALIEQHDFASGTSSRSSKMVHGGLRYLGRGAVGMARKALRERERLLREAPGLVTRMPVAFVLREGKFPGRRTFMLLLGLYDRLAGIYDHRLLTTAELAERNPGISLDGIDAAAYYTDALTDDARLVLRVLGEAVADGAVVLNYCKAERLVEHQGRVEGVVASDVVGGAEFEIRARVVVNATGAWADHLRARVSRERRMRPLRGSHLLVPGERLPVRDAVTFFHPADGRPVYVYQWLGATVIGTTDLDHRTGLEGEPVISREEWDYLLSAVVERFPDAGISERDVLSTMAGVRPVVGSGKRKDPSKEAREEAIWTDRGMVTVTGGKLTTFRPIAMRALAVIAPLVGGDVPSDDRPVFAHGAAPDTAPGAPRRQVLAGRFGSGLARLVAEARPAELEPLAGSPYCMAELRYAVRHELVAHIDDLMLRRTRLGNLLAGGGEAVLDRALGLCREELGWSEARAMSERERYVSIVTASYGLPV